MTLSIDSFNEGGYGSVALADGVTTERISAVLNTSGIDLSAGDVELWKDGSLWFAVAAADLPTVVWFIALPSGSHTFQLKQYDVTNSTYIATSNVFTIVSSPTNTTTSEGSSYFNDAFTDTNGTALGSHTAGGVNWTKYTTVGPFYSTGVTGLLSAYTIDTNQVVQAGTASTVCRAQPDIDPSATNFFYEAAFNTGSSTYSGTNPQLQFSFFGTTPAGDSGYCGVQFIINRSSSGSPTSVRYTINLWRNGAVVYTLSNANPGTVATGAHTLRFEFKSRYWRFYLDGVCLQDSRDLKYTASGAYVSDYLGDGLVLTPITPGNASIRALNSTTGTIALDSLRAGVLNVSVVGDVYPIQTGSFGPIGLANTVVPLHTGTLGAREEYYQVATLKTGILSKVYYAAKQWTNVAPLHTGILPTLVGPLYTPPDLRQFGNVRTLRTGNTATMSWAGSVAGDVTGLLTGHLGTLTYRERVHGAVTALQTGTFGPIGTATRHRVTGLRTCHFGRPGSAYGCPVSPVHRVHLGSLTAQARATGAVTSILTGQLDTLTWLGRYHIRSLGRTGRFGRPSTKRNPEC
jgi:hypothetical protein